MSMFKRKSSSKPKAVAVASSPGVAAVPGSGIPVSQEELTLANSEFNVHKITDIQNRFHGGEELITAGRIFVREGTLVKVCRKGPKPRQFFLFNDILIYGTILPTKGRYAAQHIMSLEHMTVTSDCHFMPSVYTAHSKELDVDSENAFQINHMEKSFHVFASSLADKSNWIQNLRKYIGKRTAGKESHGNFGMKAVWVPDARVNNCMGCEIKFTPFNRRHHCRLCGKVVCSDCSPHRLDVSMLRGSVKPTGKLERVCKECFQLSQTDPHKGKSPPTSPPSSPRSSMSRSKPTVIDSRSGTSPETTPTVLEQAGFAGDSGVSDNKKVKCVRPAPARPPPPNSQPPGELVAQAKARRMDSGTFNRPRSKIQTKARSGDNEEEQGMAEADEDDDDDDEMEDKSGDDDSSSDSDDSAEIDLDDVEEGDPFTMQRANSESPLTGSLTDEGLGAMCNRIQTNIRLSTINPEATEQELMEIMAQSTAAETGSAKCSQCHKECSAGEYGKINEHCLCMAHFMEAVKFAGPRTSKPETDAAVQGTEGRQAPIRPSRRADNTPSPEAGQPAATGNGQPMKPKPRQRLVTGADKSESGTKDTTEVAAAEPASVEPQPAEVEPQPVGAEPVANVDQLLSMGPEEQHPAASTAETLVSLATDPPGLSSEPLVPLPTAATPEKTPPGKRAAEKRRKKFKPSSGQGAKSPEGEDQSKPSDVDRPSPSPDMPAATQPSQEQTAAAGANEAAAMQEVTSPTAESPDMTAQSADTASAADENAAAAAVAAVTPSDAAPDAGGVNKSGDLLDLGDPEDGAATKSKSRAEKRKNKFKKKGDA